MQHEPAIPFVSLTDIATRCGWPSWCSRRTILWAMITARPPTDFPQVKFPWPMYLMRHDNLPMGCLAKHLWRILK
jgi:hypothetical protein